MATRTVGGLIRQARRHGVRFFWNDGRLSVTYPALSKVEAVVEALRARVAEVEDHLRPRCRRCLAATAWRERRWTCTRCGGEPQRLRRPTADPGC